MKLPTQNLRLRLLLLLMLIMRIALATVCCRFGRRGLVIALNFCSDFEHKVCSRFWSWSSGEILRMKFGQYFAADVWFRLRSWIYFKILKLGLVKNLGLGLVEILMFFFDILKFDKDLCKNLWYELNPRVRCVFGNVLSLFPPNHFSLKKVLSPSILTAGRSGQ